MKERLISEPILPVLPEEPREAHRTGEPVMPDRFKWRGEEYVVGELLERWKGLSPGTAAMPDRYLRRHWYRIRTLTGQEMKIYFERKARSRGSAKQRWWLYSVTDPE